MTWWILTGGIQSVEVWQQIVTEAQFTEILSLLIVIGVWVITYAFLQKVYLVITPKIWITKK